MTEMPTPNEFRDFITACLESNIDEPNIDEPKVEGCWHPLERTLQLLGDVHGFVKVAEHTKMLSSLFMRPHGQPWSSPARASVLLQSFAHAYRGSDVGVLGDDIVGHALRHEEPMVRQAAVQCLAKWGEDEYRFLEVMADHAESETSSQISETIHLALHEMGYDDESAGDCPECWMGDVEPEHGCFLCHECGCSWDRDPRVQHVESMMKEDFEEVPRKELAGWNQVAEAATNHLHSAVCTEQLPRVLENVLGIHHHLTLDLIESYKIKHLTNRVTTLNLFFGSYVESEQGDRVWFWSDRYAGNMRMLSTNDPEAPERWALDIQWK